MNFIHICTSDQIWSDLPASAGHLCVLTERFKTGEQDLCLPSPLWRPVSEAEASPASTQPLTPANTGALTGKMWPFICESRTGSCLTWTKKDKEEMTKDRTVFFFNLVKHFIGHKNVYYLQWQPASSSVALNVYFPPHWGRKSGSGGRRHNWTSRPLHFPCKSASHSQSFHSSSRNHALSQPHSLTTDETIARQLRPPTTMAGGRTSSRGFADSCKMPKNPLESPRGETLRLVAARKVRVRRSRLPRASAVHASLQVPQ